MNIVTLLKVETLKITRRRPIVYFTLAVALVSVLTVLPDYIIAKRHAQPVKVVFPEIWSLLVRGPAGGMTSFIAAIVIVMLIASEFMWKTSRQNVIDGLSKNEWFVAKGVMTLTMLTLFTVLLFGTGGMVGFLSPFTDFVRWRDVNMLRGFLATLLGQAAIAFFLAMTLRKDGVALGLYLIWQPLEILLSFFLGRLHAGWDRVITYLPMHVIQENMSPRYWDPQAATVTASIGRGPLNPPHLLSYGANLTLTMTYVVAFVALAYWSYRQRDL